MVILKIILASLLALPLVVFFYKNGHSVSVDLWPFPHQYMIPLSFLLFGVFTIGAMLGGALVWFNQIAIRLKARFQKPSE